jgi:NAD(P)-dependent dehydrogenase (short-subunit alcohol dehydrogenase family)
MKELRDKRVLITGAASGIGRAAALAFAEEGSTCLLADVDSDGLTDVEMEIRSRGAECRSYTLDVSSASEVKGVAESIEGEFDGVDVLVNVAGIAVFADFVDTTADDWKRVIGVNLWGPIYTIDSFLPGMIRRRSGHIVNVASLGGLIGFGMLDAYCVTKFGLVGLSQALSQEVKEYNIGVTAFCPGLTRTPIVDHMEVRGMSREKFFRLARFMLPRAMSAEKTGRLMVKAVKSGTTLVVTTAFARFIVALSRISPGFVLMILRFARKGNELLYR